MALSTVAFLLDDKLALWLAETLNLALKLVEAVDDFGLHPCELLFKVLKQRVNVSLPLNFETWCGQHASCLGHGRLDRRRGWQLFAPGWSRFILLFWRDGSRGGSAAAATFVGHRHDGGNLLLLSLIFVRVVQRQERGAVLARLSIKTGICMKKVL